MCGWHVSSPSVLAGLIRAPLPGEHYTHTQSRHLMALIHTHSPAVAPVQPPEHLWDELLYSLLSFSLILQSQDKIKCSSLVGHSQYGAVRNFFFPFWKEFCWLEVIMKNNFPCDSFKYSPYRNVKSWCTFGVINYVSIRSPVTEGNHPGRCVIFVSLWSFGYVPCKLKIEKYLY